MTDEQLRKFFQIVRNNNEGSEIALLSLVRAEADQQGLKMEPIYDSGELLAFRFPGYGSLHRWGPDPSPVWEDEDVEDEIDAVFREAGL